MLLEDGRGSATCYLILVDSLRTKAIGTTNTDVQTKQQAEQHCTTLWMTLLAGANTEGLDEPSVGGDLV